MNKKRVERVKGLRVYSIKSMLGEWHWKILLNRLDYSATVKLILGYAVDSFLFF